MTLDTCNCDQGYSGSQCEVTTCSGGDANGDGTIDALDITMVERIIAGLDLQTPGADANQDGNVNSIDITKVERLIAGLDCPFGGLG